MPLGTGEFTVGVLAVVTIFGLLDLRFDPNPRFLIREFIRSMSYFDLNCGFEGRCLAGLCGFESTCIFFVIRTLRQAGCVGSGGAFYKATSSKAAEHRESISRLIAQRNIGVTSSPTQGSGSSLILKTLSGQSPLKSCRYADVRERSKYALKVER